MNINSLHIILGCCICLIIFTANKKAPHDVDKNNSLPLSACDSSADFRPPQEDYQILAVRSLSNFNNLEKTQTIQVIADVQKPTVLFLFGLQKNNWIVNEIKHSKILAIVATGSEDQLISSNDPLTQLYPYKKSKDASNCPNKGIMNIDEATLAQYVLHHFNHPIVHIFEGTDSIVVTDTQKTLNPLIFHSRHSL